MVINTNMASVNAASLLANSTNLLNQSIARLSSGSRIVSPADDAAGLAVSMKFSAQINRLQAAGNNVGNAVSFSQTQDGFLQQVNTALNRMSELATQAQDVTKTDSDRAQYQTEFGKLQSYITDLASKDFNGVSLFTATALSVTTDSEAGKFSMVGINLGTATYTTATGGGTSVGTAANAATELTNVEAAINQLASDRATVGANESVLNNYSSQLSVLQNNLTAANSRITDVDVAQESTNYARYNILVQSGTAMLAQANALPNLALKLLG